MPAFASDGTVSCPFPAAWLEFFNADKNQWPANAYKTEECSASREFSHGSFVAALADGSFPPVFLWDELNYRVVAKGADGSLLATIDRVTPDSEWVAASAPVIVEAPTKPQPSVDLLSEIDALREIVAAQTAELERMRDADVHSFPVNLTDKLSDWDTDENNLTTADLSEDLAQLVTGEETLAQAVERMTPGLDELLDMAQALSNASLEKAVATIEPERANDWMERLFSERGRLRLARGTVEENLSRENLINKTVGVFGRVGAKR